MAGAIHTSTLDIRLIDDVSAPAKKVAQALKQTEQRTKAIGDAMAKAGARDNLVKQLEKVGASAHHVEAVAAAWKDYAKANNLARDSANWTKGQSASVRSWERQQIQSLRNVMREEQAAAQTHRRLQEQLDKGRPRAFGGAKDAAKHAALAVAGPGVLHETKNAYLAGAGLQSEIVKLRAAGVPEAEVQAARAQSAELAAQFANVKREAILESYKEIRSVLLHPDEAAHLLPTVVNAKSVLDAGDKTGHASEGLQFAVKGAEVLGLAQDPKRFAAYLEAFVKAKQVMGNTINPEQIFELAKYSKASGPSLSDRFKFTTGLSLAQELGGSTTGLGVDQFTKQIIGGFAGPNHAAAKEFVRLGLAKTGDFETTKTGSIKGMKPGRKVEGASLAQSDPDQWAYQYLFPAMVKAGITSQEDQLAQIRRMFPNSNAGALVSKFLTQRESFENHAVLYGNAPGYAATELNKKDPSVGLTSLTTSLENFAATLTSPVMEKAAVAMSYLGDKIGGAGQALDGFAKAHPDLAPWLAGGALAAGVAGGGAATYGLMSGLLSGFGLKGSAVALDAAAGELSAAALRLGTGGAVPVVAKAGATSAATTAAIGAGGALTVAELAGFGLPIVAAGGLLLVSSLAPKGGQQAVAPDALAPFDPLAGPAGKFSGGGPRLGLPALDTGAIETHAQEAGAKVKEALEVQARPMIDVSSIEQALSVVQRLRAELAALGGDASRTAGQIARLGGSVPALGPAQRGRFSTGGVQGE